MAKGIIWYDHGLTTGKHVQNQGDTPLCQLYSSFLVLNSVVEIHTGRWVPYSRQQIMDELQFPNDFSEEYDQYQFGPDLLDYFLPAPYFKYLGVSSITSESNYPLNYIDGKLTRQRFIASKVTSPTIEAQWKALFGLKQMEEALEYGPIVGYLYCSGDFYRHTGPHVFTSDAMDAGHEPEYHAITIMGYGTGPEGDFWIVQNSWGWDWGDGGVALIAKGIGLLGIEEKAYMICTGPMTVIPPRTK